MASPPSSPRSIASPRPDVELSPGSSPLFAISPRASSTSTTADASSSSPSPELHPRKKTRTWRVFENDGKETSKSTLWRRRILFGDNPIDAHGEEVVAEPPQPPMHEQDPSQQNLQACQSDRALSGESSDSDSYYGESTGSSEADYISEEESVLDTQEAVECTFSDPSDSESDRSSDSGDELFEVYDGCSFSVDEAVLDLFTDNIENSQTRKSLGDSLKTFLKYLPKPNNMPKTTTQLLNYVEQLAPGYKEIPHAYCAECHLYLEDSEPCAACNCTERHFFYMYSLTEQIKYYFEHRNLAEVLDKEGCKKSSDGKIRDIIDGTEFQKAKVNDKYSLTLISSTDGVSISDSSSSKIWPILFVIAEVPPHLRTKFLIVSGIWCDSVDAHINTFMKPIATELININREGGVSWTHPQLDTVHKSTVTVPIICADGPARAKVQNIVGHAGDQGCNTCEQEREFIPLTLQEAREKAAGLKRRRKKGFMFKEQPAKLRTKLNMQHQAREACETGKRVQGVNGPSIVSLFPRLDLSRCVYAEYMHGTCLGVTKHFLKLWLTVKGPWNISKYKDDLDRFMKNLSPSDDIGRLPRKVSEYLQWKASEFRSWLLFYSLPALSGKLPDAYLQHWSLFVNAMFLLLQEEISQEDLTSARIMLSQFVKKVSTLYRLRDNLYNVHQLTHYYLYALWWGPLWSNSAFYFEGYNGTLKNLIHGTKNPGKELMKNVRIAHGVQVLRNKVLLLKNIESVERQGSSYEGLTTSKAFNVPECDKAILLENGVDCPPLGVIYSRVKKERIIFTSKLHTRAKKRSNHTVKFKSNMFSGYGDIKYFILSLGTMFAVVQKLPLDHTKMFANDELGFKVKHILPIDNCPGPTIIIKATDIVTKMIRVENYLCLRPNRFEKNL